MRLSEARVLIVDDETALRDMFAKWLRAAGCREVRTAANGEEAMHTLEVHAIDVLVTDLRMPVMDGLTLVRRLAAMGRRMASILFVSGFGDLDVKEMYDLGVAVFLAKPFRLEELRSAVECTIGEVSERWKTPMALPPRQAITLLLRDGGSEECRGGELEPGCFRLGRGGLSVCWPEPLAPGKVAFRGSFADGGEERPELAGEGWVRWRSRAEQTVGIEFAYLQSPGREWILERLKREEPRSYIPAL